MDDLYGTDLYSEDERKRAQREFWQTLAFSMLANPYRGQEMQALGRAGLAGMNAREDSLVRSQRARLTKGQLERYELDNREAKQRQADLEEQRALRMRYLQGGVPAFSGEDREGNPVDYPSQPAREDWVGYQRALASINPAAAIQLEPFARRQAVRQALAGGPSGPPGAPGSYPGTSTPSASVASPRDPGFEPASLPGGPPTPFPTSLDKVTLNRAIATRLMGDAEKLRGAGLVEEADAMIARAASLLPQYDKTPRVGVDPATGKRVQFVLDNEGNPKLLPIGPDLEKLVNVDTGSVIQGRDPYTNEPRGPAIPKSVTPGERASNAVAWYNATKP
ncbi:MAG: hypothetical protein IT493_11940, partial [Gammaproteobacteria bacterium]|nr:hypothetical protein [Gammaproteobacteria bacterium]